MGDSDAKMFYGGEEIGICTFPDVSPVKMTVGGEEVVGMDSPWVMGDGNLCTGMYDIDFNGTLSKADTDILIKFYGDNYLNPKSKFSFFVGSKLASYWQNPLFNWLNPPQDKYGKHDFVGRITSCDCGNPGGGMSCVFTGNFG